MKRPPFFFISVLSGIGLVVCLGMFLGWIFWARNLLSSPTLEAYDIVLEGGRVIDPQTKLDAVLNVGISSNKIAAITSNEIIGKKNLNVKGRIVSPGFINLNVHTMNNETYRILAYDGITTALELEGGTADVNAFYKDQKDLSYLNYGISAGHAALRMERYQDTSDMIPHGEGKAATHVAKLPDIRWICHRTIDELRAGALGIGLTTAYTPGASWLEVLEMFRLAAAFEATLFVHLRQSGNKSLKGLMEVIAASAITGADLHVLHLTSIGHKWSLGLLQAIKDANRHSDMRITTDMYPYTRSMTSIQSSFFGEALLSDPYAFYRRNFIYVDTGEVLTLESFQAYQPQGGWVIFGEIPQHIIDKTIEDELVMVAGDVILTNGKGHPRNAGTFAKVIRTYVREKGTLSLMEAIEKMTLLPAKRLERRAPAMQLKGRMQVGCDADITVFDLIAMQDTATYTDPSALSEGVEYLFVAGQMLIDKGKFRSKVFPGKPVRAPKGYPKQAAYKRLAYYKILESNEP